MEAIANPVIVDAALEAKRAKNRQYVATYKLAHPEAYAASIKRNNEKLTQRRREDPVVRTKHLEELKVYNHTHREQCAAYKRAYRTRKRVAREAAAEAAAELAAEAGAGAIGT